MTRHYVQTVKKEDGLEVPVYQRPLTVFEHRVVRHVDTQMWETPITASQILTALENIKSR